MIYLPVFFDLTLPYQPIVMAIRFLHAWLIKLVAYYMVDVALLRLHCGVPARISEHCADVGQYYHHESLLFHAGNP